MDVRQIDPVFFDPLDKVDQSSRRTAGLNGKSPAIVAEQRRFGVSPREALAIREGLVTADLDDGMTHCARLDLVRRANGDDAAFVDNRHAVAELFRFLDVMGDRKSTR